MMMNEVLAVREKTYSDESISKKEYHTYSPYQQSFKANDEIRITIQNQDLYVLPHESLINFHGIISKVKDDGSLETGNITAKLRNNCMAYFLDEIRYEINGVEIDRTRFVGTTSTIKNYVYLNQLESKKLFNSGWTGSGDFTSPSYFEFSLPLKNLLGFAEDFKKVILNCKHELVLLISKNMNEVYETAHGNNNFRMEMLSITWKIPHITPSDSAKIKLYDIIKSGANLPLAFRSWDTYINPKLTQGTQQIWNVKLAANRERPRFALIAFKEGNQFIANNLTNLKVYLNSETYPYDDLKIDFSKNRFAHLYEMYSKFQNSYYNRNETPLLTPLDFVTKAPIIVVDLSYQNEMVKSGPIDVRVSAELSRTSSENTQLYCILLHDRLVEYNPLNGLVHRIV
jgi:hypothetical protein